jgi:hypothetical protein
MPHSASRGPTHDLPHPRLETGARLRRLAAAARRTLARYPAELVAYWNRQPFDRFWPPHP